MLPKRMIQEDKLKAAIKILKSIDESLAYHLNHEIPYVYQDMLELIQRCK